MRRIAALLALAAAACGVPSLDPGEQALAQPIAGGVPATDYPEACLINLAISGQPAYCSASLIAPRMLLTAGHCVSGVTVTSARCPMHPNAAVAGRALAVERGIPHPQFSATQTVITNDIGVVVLGEQVALNPYPSRAQTAPSVGTNIVRIGRILDDQVTNSAYKSTGTIDAVEPQFIVVTSDLAVQRGDSGGPDIAAGSTHVVQGVNSHVRTQCSGTGSCSEYAEAFTRVDAYRTWLDQQVSQFGGQLSCSVAGCPTGQRCDTASGNCVAGCSTAGCGANLRCDRSTETCVAGCAINGCDPGRRCNPATQLCVDGCQTTGCLADERCDETTLACVPGCARTGCPTGQACDTPTQRCSALGQTSPCPVGQVQDQVSGTCVPPGSAVGADRWVTGALGCASAGRQPSALAAIAAFALLRASRRSRHATC